MRAREVWRIPEPWLEQAQDDATIVAIHEMESAGVDIISDGEMRRESYSNRLANALGGVDRERPGSAISRSGRPDIVPLVSGPIRRLAPVEVRDLTFLRAHTTRKVKITLPGPFTMTQQAENAHYPDEDSLAMAYAEAVNEEIKDLFAAGADVVQIDEPYMQARPELARRYGLKALNRALAGRHRHDRGASVLRLRLHHEGQAGRLLVFAGARELPRPPGINRGRAAQARSVDSEGATLQDHHPGRDRP